MSELAMKALAERACGLVCDDLGDPEAFDLVRYDRSWDGEMRATILRRPRLASEGTGDVSATVADDGQPERNPALVRFLVSLVRARAREHAIAATGTLDPNPPWACHASMHLLPAMLLNATVDGPDPLLACLRQPGDGSYEGPHLIEVPGRPVEPKAGSKNLSLSIPTRYAHGVANGPRGRFSTKAGHPKVSGGLVRMLLEVGVGENGAMFGVAGDFGLGEPDQWISFPKRILPDTIVAGLTGLPLSRVAEHPLLQVGGDPIVRYAKITTIPKPREGQAMIVGLSTDHVMMAPAPEGADLSWLDIGRKEMADVGAPDREVARHRTD